MRKLMTTGFLLGFLSLTALAADVTGKWTAQMTGRDEPTDATRRTRLASERTYLVVPSVASDRTSRSPIRRSSAP